MVKKLKILTLALLSTLLTSAQCEHDTINPWFVDFDYEITIQCSDFTNNAMPIANDDCDQNVEIGMLEDVMQGDCEGTQTIYRIYRAYDDAGNQATETQIIHVVDETAPTINIAGNYHVGCTDPIVFDQPVVTDNCTFISLMSFDITDTIDDCTIAYSRIWSAQDACGNASTATQTITAMDLESPVIMGEVYVEVQADVNLDTVVFVTAFDGCSSITLTHNDTEVSGNSIIRIYTASDGCGNISTFEQIIHVINNHVAICHQLGNGNFITIYVAPQAVNAHLAHGDYLGPCRTDGNQLLPYVNLERLPNGKFKKYVRCK